MQKVVDFTGKLTEDFTFKIEGSESASMMYLLSFFKDKSLEISVKVARRSRSAAQNRYMWGVIVPTVGRWFRDTQGEKYTPDEIYLWVRMSLLEQRPVLKTILGQEIIVMEHKRFSEMTTAEFAEAVDIIVKKMAERDCVIELPRDQNYIQEFIKN